MALEYRILRVNAGTGRWRVEKLHASGPIDAGVQVHVRGETWRSPPLSPGNPVLIGAGHFTLARLLGAHRLTVVFRSPLSMGLHASTLGGAAYALARTGVDALLVEGYSEEPAIIWAIARGGGLEVRVEYATHNMLDRVYRGYKGFQGTRALHLWVAEQTPGLERLEARILVVGPAAWTTRAGSIVSWVHDRSGRPTSVVDGASRGGGGSVLAQGHGVAAIIVGGPRGVKPRDLTRLVEDALGEKYYRAVEKATVKYRYDPKLGTGGTFGVNYVHYRELLPALAYNTIYMSRTVRLLLHEKIMRHFWRPFQREVFESPVKPWRTCGEPCSVACKKVWRGVKLDYEPAHAMGPMIGVITLEDAARLVELTDDLGLDAIEAGHIVAWTFDLVAKGLLTPAEAGIDSTPVLDPIALNPEASRENAVMAEKILRGLAARSNRFLALIASEGARRAAMILDEENRRLARERGTGYRDLLVYAAFGGRGYMTPNYYWSPGMVAPLYVLGRYWTNYSPTYMEPEEYARTSFSRALKELLIDNAGICRFHRKWAEKALDKLYQHAGLTGDPLEHAKHLYRQIAEYNKRAGAEPVPWESRKTMDLVATIAAEIGAPGWEEALGSTEKLMEWWRTFKQTIDALLY